MISVKEFAKQKAAYEDGWLETNVTSELRTEILSAYSTGVSVAIIRRYLIDICGSDPAYTPTTDNLRRQLRRRLDRTTR